MYYVSIPPVAQLTLIPLFRHLSAFAFGVFCNAAFALTPPDAFHLLESYSSMEESLLRSNFLRPIQISSQETAEHLDGDIFSIVEYDMSTINATASSSERWCEVMLLLSNIQACQAKFGKKNDTLAVVISGSKTADISGAPPTEFLLRIQSASNDYLDATLQANQGPLGTSNIRLRLQAIPLSATRSFVNLHYSYDTQWLGRMTMQAYLQTAGRGKVGFTRELKAFGDTVYIGGARGVIERNTMRYFLGFDCALASHTLQAQQRFSSMAQCWYEQVEKYPVQLHEMQRNEYLNMKAEEYRRQQKNP